MLCGDQSTWAEIAINASRQGWLTRTMAFLGIYLHLLWLLVVPLAAISDVDLLEDCPASPEGIVDDVIQAACAYVFGSEEAASFRNETRSRHDAADKTDR